MKNILLFLIVFFVSGVLNISSQTPEPDAGSEKVCISQAAANKCAENARVVSALEAKILVLETAIAEKDKNVAEIRDAAKKNEAELKAALTETQTKLATATGQLIGAESNIVRLTAIVDFMLKNGRKKCGPLTFICIQ